jgi:transposase
MKKLGGTSRRELFDKIECVALRALPSEPYECAEWIERTVNADYHVEVDRHWYSVPYQLTQEPLWARATATTVEFLHKNVRVASHALQRRSRVPYKHTTDPAHMPAAHQRHANAADSVLTWAVTAGPMTLAMVKRLLDANPVREQGWRSARGLQRIGEKYGTARTELACERALRFGARSYQPIANMLALGRENAPLPEDEPAERAAIMHENVRGRDYYN